MNFLSSIETLCEESICKATFNSKGKTYPFVWDYGHLTEGESAFLAQAVVDFVENRQ